jgi:hypothetical protein
MRWQPEPRERGQALFQAAIALCPGDDVVAGPVQHHEQRTEHRVGQDGQRQRAEYRYLLADARQEFPVDQGSQESLEAGERILDQYAEGSPDEGLGQPYDGPARWTMLRRHDAESLADAAEQGELDESRQQHVVRDP